MGSFAVPTIGSQVGPEAIPDVLSHLEVDLYQRALKSWVCPGQVRKFVGMATELTGNTNISFSHLSTVETINTRHCHIPLHHISIHCIT